MAVYETSLNQGDYVILQDDCDYSFSQDSVLLANIATLKPTDSVLDLGCGSGILSTLAIIKKNVSSALGIEVQPHMATLARESATLNKIDDIFRVVCDSVVNIKNIVKAESFDKVLCNPPYFANDGKRQIIGKEISRTESSATLEDFISASAYALKFGGDLWTVIKSHRLAEAISCMCAHSLQPKEITLVYPKLSLGVDVAIIKARKGGKVGLILNTLIVSDEDGNYTDTFKELYN